MNFASLIALIPALFCLSSAVTLGMQMTVSRVVVRKAARRMGIEHAMLVDSSGKIHLTRAMQQRIKFTYAHAAPEILP